MKIKQIQRFETSSGSFSELRGPISKFRPAFESSIPDTSTLREIRSESDLAILTTLACEKPRNLPISGVYVIRSSKDDYTEDPRSWEYEIVHLLSTRELKLKPLPKTNFGD